MKVWNNSKDIKYQSYFEGQKRNWFFKSFIPEKDHIVFIWFQSCLQRPKHHSRRQVERKPSFVHQAWKTENTEIKTKFYENKPKYQKISVRVWTAT